MRKLVYFHHLTKATNELGTESILPEHPVEASKSSVNVLHYSTSILYQDINYSYIKSS